MSFPRFSCHPGSMFKLSTKILTAALLLYKICSLSCYFHAVASTFSLSTLSLPCCRFHVVTSTLSLPCCRFHVVASMLSLPRCHLHVVASMLLLPRCCVHVVASTLSFPHYRFHVVACTLSLSGIYRDFNQHGRHVFLEDFCYFFHISSRWGVVFFPGFPCSTMAGI